MEERMESDASIFFKLRPNLLTYCERQSSLTRKVKLSHERGGKVFRRKQRFVEVPEEEIADFVWWSGFRSSELWQRGIEAHGLHATARRRERRFWIVRRHIQIDTYRYQSQRKLSLNVNLLIR